MSQNSLDSAIGSCDQPATPELKKDIKEDMDEKLEDVGAFVPGVIDSESADTETNISNPQQKSSEQVQEDNAPEMKDEEQKSLLKKEEEDQEELESEEESLPDTVTVLEAPNGSKVYVVGSAHFSLESINDVDKTIRLVRPQYILLELCKFRTAILSLDQETLMLESSTLDTKKMIDIIKSDGAVRGMFYILMLSVSAHITNQLGMAPGGEFRAALDAKSKYAPNAVVKLVDRLIRITLERAVKKLTLWQKMKFIRYLVFSYEPISSEDVEKCKEKDVLDKLIEEISTEYPEFCEVLVKERDLYLSYAIYENCLANTIHGENKAHDSVAVVGIGHVKGIKEHWGKVTKQDILNVVKIPKTSTCERVTFTCIKIAFWSLVAYGTYRYILPNAAKGKLEEVANSSFALITPALKSIKAPKF